MIAAATRTLDPFDHRRVAGVAGPLAAFNDVLVLTAADVHIARRLGTIVGETDDDVLLAVALAARAPRVGHVCIDLASAADTVQSDADEDVDIAGLPWPDAERWLTQVRRSALVSDGGDGGARPLRLDGTLLYLDRYWRYEQTIAHGLISRAREVPGVDQNLLSTGLDRLFDGDPPDLQRLAAAVAVLRMSTVVAGGPGTGKTTTVAKILALLDEQANASDRRPPRVALAAPTGKAAARLEESVHHVATTLDVDAGIRARLLDVKASTIHRLLGWRPDNRSRFRHDLTHPLPFDVVVVDECSMVSVSLMAQLVDAVRDDARLILIGDPNQLSSVEAGAVLGDVVGPAEAGLRMTPDAATAATAVTGQDAGIETNRSGAVGNGIIVLRRAHRFGGAIAHLAEAIRTGDSDAAMEILGAGYSDVTWLVPEDQPDPVRSAVVESGGRVIEAAAAGDGRTALEALGSIRILCAHRQGPHGVSTWLDLAEQWLKVAIPNYGTGGRWYLGRPLLVTHNDYGLQLFNGDIGVIIRSPKGPPIAAFERRGEIVTLGPARLSSIETVHAMTIHKSQGSQFQTVAVVLPKPDSRILTRELFYTAATRARTRAIIVGSEAAIRQAIDSPVGRASGLRKRLWGTND
jgi:exodeoxyribonuclease V alpha subunit